MRGRLAPGFALDKTELARRFGASRTPVRDAVRHLEAIGLAVARPHCGTLDDYIPLNPSFHASAPRMMHS